MFGQGSILLVAMYLVAIFMSITFHEFFHAWSAYQLGDDTARRMGRLTLNPIKHFDPLGAIMIVFMAISRFGIGWGKPVPVNPYNLRGNSRVSFGLTSAAGPFSNLVLAAVAAIPLRLVPDLGGLPGLFLQVMVTTNLGLAMFNLLPFPPLDGFGVAQGILATFRTRWANQWAEGLDRFAAYGPFVLLALILLGQFGGFNILGAILTPAIRGLYGLLLG